MPGGSAFLRANEASLEPVEVVDRIDNGLELEPVILGTFRNLVSGCCGCFEPVGFQLTLA